MRCDSRPAAFTGMILTPKHFRVTGAKVQQEENSKNKDVQATVLSGSTGLSCPGPCRVGTQSMLQNICCLETGTHQSMLQSILCLGTGPINEVTECGPLGDCDPSMKLQSICHLEIVILFSGSGKEISLTLSLCLLNKATVSSRYLYSKKSLTLLFQKS